MIRTSLMTDVQFAEFIRIHPASGGKGDSTASSTEKSQGNFTNLLQQTFATNNAQQQSQLNFLNTKLQSAIDNPTGYSKPSTLAALRAEGTDAVAAENKTCNVAVQNKAGRAGRCGCASKWCECTGRCTDCGECFASR